MPLARPRGVVVPVVCAVAVVAVATLAQPARADLPTSGRAPNLYGESGLVHSANARTGHLELMLGARGFGFYSPDFVVPGETDTNTYLGSHTSISVGFFNALQLSLAARAAANVNAVAGTSASVGDVIPSLKIGYTFLPVAFAADVRAFLPTRTNQAGFSFSNTALGTRGLFTLDLKENIEIPVRVHLNGGFTFNFAKNALGANQQFFEQNPSFFDGPSGQLMALPTQQWFYDMADGVLAIEVPLPIVTPFIEARYAVAVGVPADRGLNDGAYDPVQNAHIVITPGLRITPGAGLNIDLAADIGLTGNGGGLAVDVTQLVDGQPVNPLWMVQLGIGHAFELGAGGGGGDGGGGAPSGRIEGCVTDVDGLPVTSAVVEGPPLQGARIAVDAKGCFATPPLAVGDVQLAVLVPGLEPATAATLVEDGKVSKLDVKLAGKPSGAVVASAAGNGRVAGFVTNKEDSTVEAEVDVTDARGTRTLGKAAGGAFEAEVAAGRVFVVARAEKFLASGAEVLVDGNKTSRATVVLRSLPKKKAVSLEAGKLAISGRVPFEYKTPRLQSTAEFILDEVVDVMLRHPEMRVRVEVYAEPVDVPEAGQALADARAAGVVEYLASHGVARTRLETKGVPNVEEKERRVEIIVLP